MEEAKQFIDNFIKVAHTAKLLSLQPNIDAFNTQLELMDSFLSEDLKSRFGMTRLHSPKRDEFYKKIAKLPPPNPMGLFRIDKCKYLSDSYLAYVCFEIFDHYSVYGHALHFQKINDSFIITSLYTYGEGRDGLEREHWYFSGGEKLEQKDLEPIEILRVTPPIGSDENLKHYKSNNAMELVEAN